VAKFATHLVAGPKAQVQN